MTNNALLADGTYTHAMVGYGLRPLSPPYEMLLRNPIYGFLLFYARATLWFGCSVGVAVRATSFLALPSKYPTKLECQTTSSFIETHLCADKAMNEGVIFLETAVVSCRSAQTIAPL